MRRALTFRLAVLLVSSLRPALALRCGKLMCEYQYHDVEGTSVQSLQLRLSHLAPTAIIGHDRGIFGSSASSDASWGAVLEGYIQAPVDGSYLFSTQSYGDSEVWISRQPNTESDLVRAVEKRGAPYDCRRTVVGSTPILWARGSVYFIRAYVKHGVDRHLTEFWSLVVGMYAVESRLASSYPSTQIYSPLPASLFTNESHMVRRNTYVPRPNTNVQTVQMRRPMHQSSGGRGVAITASIGSTVRAGVLLYFPASSCEIAKSQSKRWGVLHEDYDSQCDQVLHAPDGYHIALQFDVRAVDTKLRIYEVHDTHSTLKVYVGASNYIPLMCQSCSLMTTSLVTFRSTSSKIRIQMGGRTQFATQFWSEPRLSPRGMSLQPFSWQQASVGCTLRSTSAMPADRQMPALGSLVAIGQSRSVCKSTCERREGCWSVEWAADGTKLDSDWWKGLGLSKLNIIGLVAEAPWSESTTTRSVCVLHRFTEPPAEGGVKDACVRRQSVLTVEVHYIKTTPNSPPQNYCKSAGSGYRMCIWMVNHSLFLGFTASTMCTLCCFLAFVRREHMQIRYTATSRASSARLAAARSQDGQARVLEILHEGTFVASRDDAALSQEECAICLFALDDGEECVRLPACSHKFHKQCIARWVLRVANCPACRANLIKPRSISTSAAQSLVASESDAETITAENPLRAVLGGGLTERPMLMLEDQYLITEHHLVDEDAEASVED